MLTLLAQKVDIRGNLGPNMQFDAGALVGRFAGVGLLIAALSKFGYILLEAYIGYSPRGIKARSKPRGQ